MRNSHVHVQCILSEVYAYLRTRNFWFAKLLDRLARPNRLLERLFAIGSVGRAAKEILAWVGKFH